MFFHHTARYYRYRRGEQAPPDVIASDIDNTEMSSSTTNGGHTDIWTEQSLRTGMRGFEFELFPRVSAIIDWWMICDIAMATLLQLLFSESRTIDALIQSDVTRYLEFKFVSKFATLTEEKIVLVSDGCYGR